MLDEIVDTKLIQADPKVMMGKPVVAGTRITVESILERLAAGETKEHILAALLFTLTGLLRSRA